jgi:2-C-methyl-D-erythritol 4-phosphate cytidylyltransferase
MNRDKNAPFVSMVVVAGGSGKRFNSRISKQFIELRGLPLFVHALRRLEASPIVSEIILVLPAEVVARRQYTSEFLQHEYDITKLSQIVAGGENRHDSVRGGVSAVDLRAMVIGIHDGVRPFVSNDLLVTLLQTAQRYGSAVPSLKVDHTLKKAISLDDGLVVEGTIDRANVFQVQTPQFFNAALIAQVFAATTPETWDRGPTDDGQVLEWQGIPVHLCEGDKMNIKITTPDDLRMAEVILQLFEGAHAF